jgi:hypothetical protein
VELADYWFTVVMLPPASDAIEVKAMASVTKVGEILRVSFKRSPCLLTFIPGKRSMVPPAPEKVCRD